MKLYGSLTSPYARKVRAFLAEKGLAHDFIVEGPNDPAGTVARLNPLGKVPVLQRDDGEVLFDSPMIIEYLDGLGAESLIPADAELRWRAQRWHALGQGICDAVVARLLEIRRAADKQEASVVERQEGKVAAALAFAETRVTPGRSLIGEHFGIADIALAIALEYIDLRYPHDWRHAYPRLRQWLAGVADRACLKDTRPPA